MEENKNPNLKQWLPGYGIFKAREAMNYGEPSIFDSGNFMKDVIARTYHISVISIPLIIGLVGLEKLLH